MKKANQTFKGLKGVGGRPPRKKKQHYFEKVADNGDIEKYYVGEPSRSRRVPSLNQIASEPFEVIKSPLPVEPVTPIVLNSADQVS